MGGYGAREVAKMLGLSVGQVRAYVRAGFLAPGRGPRGELRFSFQDLVLLRKLKEQLPEGRPLRGVHIRAEGDRIVVGDGESRWSPESGQGLFDFGARELARKVAPLRASFDDAAGWYERGCDLEESAPDDARD